MTFNLKMESDWPIMKPSPKPRDYHRRECKSSKKKHCEMLWSGYDTPGTVMNPQKLDYLHKIEFINMGKRWAQDATPFFEKLLAVDGFLEGINFSIRCSHRSCPNSSKYFPVHAHTRTLN